MKEVAWRDLERYMQPSEEMKGYVDKLLLFYQFTHQEHVKDYAKKGGDKYFKGTLGEFIHVRELEEFHNYDGKPWEFLLKSIFLVENYTPKADMSILPKLNDSEKDELLKLLTDGIVAYGKILRWLKPISNKSVITAIKEAVKTNFDYQFNIHFLADITNYKTSDSISLYPYLLEILSPDELIFFLKHNSMPFSDCLIVTLQKNKVKDFKGFFTMFLIFKGKLYSIDNQERRLNLDNTAGMRNPGLYLDRKYCNVWLPVDYIFDEEDNVKKVKKTKLPILKKAKVYKVVSWDEIAKENIAYIYWLNMFIYRILEHISTGEIETGYTPMTTLPLLEDINKKNILEYPDTKNKGTYLVEKYGKDITALTVTKDDMPMVIGSEKYLDELISYKRRRHLAFEIQQRLYNDFDRKHKEFKRWFYNFMEKQDIKWLINRALQNNEYGFMHYHQFAEDNTPKFRELRKSTVLSVSDTNSYWYSVGRYNHYRYGKWIIVESYYYKGYWEDKCILCDYKIKKYINIKFKDYRQFLSFFNLSKNKIPKVMIEHLHQRGEMYVGNSILDDIDPVDGINDPWFRNAEDKPDYLFAHIGEPSLVITIPICKKCLNKFEKKVVKERIV